MYFHQVSRLKTIKTGELDITAVSHRLQFWLLLSFTVPSLICSLIIIYRYLSTRTIRHAFHHHSILLIIFTNVLIILTDVSWMMDNHRRLGQVWSSTSTFCLIWWLLDDGLYSIQTGIIAWASIERHIIIFHSGYFATSRQRLIYHYLPPILIIIYLFGFYFVVLLLIPCQNIYFFDEIECGSSPCYLEINILSIWDTIVNSFIPTLLIAIFNITLFYRIIAQKQRLRQPIQWKKHRRMSIQLLSLSGVYLFLNLPLTIIYFLEAINKFDSSVGYTEQLLIFLMTYGVTLSLPFVVFLNRLTLDRHRNLRVSPIVTVIHAKRTTANEVSTVG